MDDERKRLLPGADQGQAERTLAYRSAHSLAFDYLAANPASLVILDATYGPYEQRASLKELLGLTGSDMRLIECTCSPNDAAQRFRDRSVDHAAIDLTEARVRDIAATFPLYGGGLLLDTSAKTVDECYAELEAYLNRGTVSFSVPDWAAERPRVDSRLIPVRTRASGLLSPKSRFFARVRRIRIWLSIGAAITATSIGISLLLTGSLTDRPLLAVSGAVAAVVSLWRLLETEKAAMARALLKAGDTPRLGPPTEVVRTNRELIKDYLERVPPETRALTVSRMPSGRDGHPEVPVVFVIQPLYGQRFDVRCRLDGDPWDEVAIAEAARSGPFLPFEWAEYSAWRRGLSREEYFGPSRRGTSVLRVSHLSEVAQRGNTRTVEVRGHRLRYEDYVVAEQSARLEIDGQLPYMREFFEGRPWSESRVDLLTHELGRGNLYTLMANVSVVITTSDGLIVLQRRSDHVQSAAGGLSNSAAGAVDWDDVTRGMTRVGPTNWHRSMRTAVFREVYEELGLMPNHFHREEEPFIAAALNLRYGRDLNFYAHLRFAGTGSDIMRLFRPSGAERLIRRRSRDRWEVGHLMLLPFRDVTEEGTLTNRAREVIRDARHLQGALFAAARVGVLRE